MSYDHRVLAVLISVLATHLFGCTKDLELVESGPAVSAIRVSPVPYLTHYNVYYLGPQKEPDVIILDLKGDGFTLASRNAALAPNESVHAIPCLLGIAGCPAAAPAAQTKSLVLNALDRGQTVVGIRHPEKAQLMGLVIYFDDIELDGFKTYYFVADTQTGVFFVNSHDLAAESGNVDARGAGSGSSSSGSSSSDSGDSSADGPSIR